MAKSYSIDLREKAVQSLNDQENPKQVARNFKISLATVYRWKNKIKTGNLDPKKRADYTTKVSRDSVVEYVLKNPDYTLYEIGTNFNITASTVHKYLTKMNFTYKKKYFVQRILSFKERRFSK